MARRKKLIKILFGILIGILLSQLFASKKLLTKNMCFGNKPESLPENQENQPQKKLIFVGVMTASQYLDNRAKAVYNTWGRTVPGKILFYSSETSHSHHVPLVPLVGVDDSYPPQKKSFMMLKHMYDNYIDQYEWFLRADDDVYIRTDRLEVLLRSVDSRKAWFIGQTGRGNTEEFGLLSLENDENFCMGGPGVIFSRETLKRMAPYVDECLANLYTTHEDVELGRCVRRFAGISCTWSYEASDCDCKMQVILYHNQSGQAAFTGDLKQKEVHRAITMHPVKQPKNMYRLHKYIKGLRIQNYDQERINLHRDIVVSMSELGYRRNRLNNVELDKGLPLFPEARGSEGYLGDSNLLGIPQSLNRHKPENLSDVLEWELISKTLYSYRDLNPRKRIGSSLKEGLNDIVRDIMELINSYSKQRGRVIDFKDILYGYWRLNPLHGVDLILDLLLVYRKYRGHKMTVQVRRHAYVQQTFTDIVIREVNFSNTSLKLTEQLPVHKKIVNKIISTFEENLQLFSASNRKNPTINFILPLSGRFEVFQRFLKNYEEVCIKTKEATKLFIVLYESNEYEQTKKLIERKYKKSIELILVQNESFARAKALEYGIKALKNDDLMLFIDVDMYFKPDSLQRIRLNTRQNQSVYFPIVYSLYNPKILNQTAENVLSSGINNDYGFWRQFGFGIVSLYKSDYRTLGGFNLQISGWGFEDVNFYDNAIQANLKIVRSVDPGLIHVYHSVNCDNNLDTAQKNMCLGTQASTLGSFKQLQRLFQKYKHLFR